jgi:hypothetical protein
MCCAAILWSIWKLRNSLCFHFSGSNLDGREGDCGQGDEDVTALEGSLQGRGFIRFGSLHWCLAGENDGKAKAGIETGGIIRFGAWNVAGTGTPAPPIWKTPSPVWVSNSLTTLRNQEEGKSPVSKTDSTYDNAAHTGGGAARANK